MMSSSTSNGGLSASPSGSIQPTTGGSTASPQGNSVGQTSPGEKKGAAAPLPMEVKKPDNPAPKRKGNTSATGPTSAPPPLKSRVVPVVTAQQVVEPDGENRAGMETRQKRAGSVAVDLEGNDVPSGRSSSQLPVLTGSPHDLPNGRTPSTATDASPNADVRNSTAARRLY